jgi:NADH:ubiquinone oxidoreductase subunit 6 (subunit J)
MNQAPPDAGPSKGIDPLRWAGAVAVLVVSIIALLQVGFTPEQVTHLAKTVVGTLLLLWFLAAPTG